MANGAKHSDELSPNTPLPPFAVDPVLVSQVSNGVYSGIPGMHACVLSSAEYTAITQNSLVTPQGCRDFCAPRSVVHLLLESPQLHPLSLALGSHADRRWSFAT
jgi:hypothetical protein